jgi:arylsulfatase A-like enzyme
VAKSLEVARDSAIGLALLHMPVPHPPYFYNAATGKNDRGATPITGVFQQTQEGYVDALALTDTIIGRLRRSMEHAGVWDTTTVILSADHPFRHRSSLDGRPSSQRVPYLIKMAGPQAALCYDTPFSALLTKKLILAILAGELSRPDEIPSWIDGHRADYRLD